jgi:hypothetical protein
MQADSFVLLNVDNREVLGVAPALAYSSFPGVVVTVQSQGVYIYDVRASFQTLFIPVIVMTF